MATGWEDRGEGPGQAGAGAAAGAPAAIDVSAFASVEEVETLGACVLCLRCFSIMRFSDHDHCKRQISGHPDVAVSLQCCAKRACLKSLRGKGSLWPAAVCKYQWGP